MAACVKTASDSVATKRLDALRVQLMAGRKPAGVGHRIRQARRDLDLTQREVAAQLGVDIARLSEWERDVHLPSARRMEELSDVLRRPVAWFYEKDDTPPDLMATLEELRSIALRLEARSVSQDARIDELLRAQGLDPDEIKRMLPRPPQELLP